MGLLVVSDHKSHLGCFRVGTKQVMRTSSQGSHEDGWLCRIPIHTEISLSSSSLPLDTLSPYIPTNVRTGEQPRDVLCPGSVYQIKFWVAVYFFSIFLSAQLCVWSERKGRGGGIASEGLRVDQIRVEVVIDDRFEGTESCLLQVVNTKEAVHPSTAVSGSKNSFQS